MLFALIFCLWTTAPVGAIHCFKCNSTKTSACTDAIGNSSSVVLSSCSFGIGTYCATISYTNLDGVLYVERDCLPTNLDCDTLQKLMWSRFGPFENFKCTLCDSEKCNSRGVFGEERRPSKNSEDASRIYSSKIAIFLYILFLAILIGLAALCEF